MSRLMDLSRKPGGNPYIGQTAASYLQARKSGNQAEMIRTMGMLRTQVTNAEYWGHTDHDRLRSVMNWLDQRQ